MAQGFRDFSTQIAAGFLIYFFTNYQPQFANEVKRFNVAVMLLILIPILTLLINAINSITAPRFFFLKTFFGMYFGILRVAIVWLFTAIVSKFFNEVLESLFNLDASYRLLIGIGLISFVAALLESMPKPPVGKEKE